MAFKIFWEKVLVWSSVFKIVDHIKQLIPDDWMANLLQTDEIDPFKHWWFNQFNNLFGPFILRCPPILFYNFFVIRAVRVISAWTFVVSTSAWNVEITVYAKNSQFPESNKFGPLVVCLIEVFMDSAFLVMSRIFLVWGLLVEIVLDCWEVEGNFELLNFLDFWI